MFKHCNRSFKQYETWFLFDNRGFYERSLKLGRCPICNKHIAELIEKRKSDDKVFTQIAVGEDRVQRLTNLNRHNVNYSSLDKKTQSKVIYPVSIRYGENKLVKVGGKTVQRMNAVSQYGYREKIKDIPLKTNTTILEKEKQCGELV